MGAAQHEEIGALHRDDVGRARLVVDERELAEVFAHTEDAEDHLAPVLADEDDLDPTVAYDEEGITRIIFEDDDAPLRIVLLPRQFAKALQLGVVELGEDRNGAKEVADIHPECLSSWGRC